MHKLVGTFIAILIWSATCALHAEPPWTSWQESEVTVLFPLPTEIANRSQMLGVEATGAKGPLIPNEILDQLPALVASMDRDQTYHQSLRVVGFRLDPCFYEGPLPARSCRRQVRLVWQPLVEVEHQVLARDAALHTFYEFSEEAWLSFLHDYKDKSSAHVDKDALLRKLILQHCGRENLTRVTMMSLDFFGNQWVFKGWEITGTELERMSIPGILGRGQVLAVQQRNSLEYQMAIAPLLPNPAKLQLIEDSAAALARLSESQIKELTRENLAIENPRLHNPGTVDCASCHLANSMVQWSLRHFSTWNWTADFADTQFTNTRDSTQQTTSSTDQLRALGYNGRTPIVSQRVKNETREVLRLLNSNP